MAGTGKVQRGTGAMPTRDKTGVGSIDGNTRGQSGGRGSTPDKTGVGNINGNTNGSRGAVGSTTSKFPAPDRTPSTIAPVKRQQVKQRFVAPPTTGNTRDKTGVGAINGNTRLTGAAFGSTQDRTGTGDLPGGGSVGTSIPGGVPSRTSGLQQDSYGAPRFAKGTKAEPDADDRGGRSDRDADDVPRYAPGTTRSIPGTGISFHPGGLHASTHTPQGQPISSSKMSAALAGKFGPKAVRQANLARTMEGFHHPKALTRAKARAGR